MLFSKKELKNEAAYWVAIEISRDMLKKGLISEDDFDLIRSGL